MRGQYDSAMTVELSLQGYAGVREIGDVYRRGDDVLLDLTELQDEVCKRIVDFCAGLSYDRGYVERVRSHVFLVAHQGA